VTRRRSLAARKPALKNVQIPRRLVAAEREALEGVRRVESQLVADLVTEAAVVLVVGVGAGLEVERRA
jgi:hypothetical protein